MDREQGGENREEGDRQNDPPIEEEQSQQGSEIVSEDPYAN